MMNPEVSSYFHRLRERTVNEPFETKEKLIWMGEALVCGPPPLGTTGGC
jgi:hypothetical protein